jgi:RND superfamily putative drug exporter
MLRRMAGRISWISTRAPRPLLAGWLVLALALSAYAASVPGKLALNGGDLDGSRSAVADERLSAGLGYEAQPSYLVVLTGSEPVAAPASQVAIESSKSQIGLIDGVAEVVETEPAASGLTTMLAVHLSSRLDPAQIREVGDSLRDGLDPGALTLAIGGRQATQDAARSAVLDEAPKLLALIAPAVLLLLAGSLGLRASLAALIGMVLAGATSIAAVGIVAALVEIQALAVVAAGLLGAVLGVQGAAALLVRYRGESATLGAGPEALESSLQTLLRGAGTGMFSAALVGGALFAIPIDFTRSIGGGILAGALLGPPLGMLPMAAGIGARVDSEAGGALPLVADDARTEDAPRSFRALPALRLGHSRGLITLLPLLVVAVLAIPLLDSEAIGLSASELPADQQAATAGAEITGGYGPGANGPLIVVLDGPGEAPGVTLYRNAIARLPEIAGVSRAASVGPLGAFEAVPDSLPQSLAAQRAAEEIDAVPPPSGRRLTGPAAELGDSARRLAEDLPLVALLALLGTAALWSLLLRSALGPLLALSSLIAPLAGLAAMVAVFGDGLFTRTLDYEAAGAPHLESYVVVGAVLLAIGLSRGADLAVAVREERPLSGGAAESLTRSGLLTPMPVTVATLVGVTISAVWLGMGLPPAKEIAIGLGAGLLADLLLARTLLAPALARLAVQARS